MADPAKATGNFDSFEVANCSLNSIEMNCINWVFSKKAEIEAKAMGQKCTTVTSCATSTTCAACGGTTGITCDSTGAKDCQTATTPA